MEATSSTFRRAITFYILKVHRICRCLTQVSKISQFYPMKSHNSLSCMTAGFDNELLVHFLVNTFEYISSFIDADIFHVINDNGFFRHHTL